MSSLSLAFLGSFQAEYDGKSLTHFRTKSVQALLVYLACQPEVHQREHLMALLWPGLPQQSAQGSLRQTLYLLRKAIPELPAKDGDGLIPLLLANGKTVQMNPNGRFDLDLHTFTEQLKGDESGWTEAVDLYRGDFLADFYLPDSATFEEWINARRADLRRRALEALETLTDYAMQIGDLAAAEAHARRQLEIDNLRESAHRQLMGILARNGRRAEALSQYEACVVVLHNELAVAPSAPTESLYAAIRDEMLPAAPPMPGGQPWLAVAARDLDRERDLIEEATPSIHNNLPVQATPFIGREAELAVLDEFLANPDVRLITIVGPGGMGKTRLALETAQRQFENFEHGVWFSSLATLSSPDEIVPATAQALHFNFYESGTPRQQLLDYFRNKSLLLILDNYEHMLDGADLVSDVLQNALQVKVVVTSREPLRLVEEQLFHLGGLAFTHGDVVEEDEAVQLFLERAHRLRPDLTLKPADIPHVTTICRQVDGMPLGLELAAAWVDTFSLAEITSELRQSLDLLESDLRNIADRHRSLRTVFEASWDRLQSSEQQLFAQMSVFRGGFTRTGAWEICAPQLSQPAFHRLLATLTRKSFLKHDMENGRYDIHELMRQFGAEKLAQTSEIETATRDRHLTYFTDLAKELSQRTKYGKARTSLDQCEAEYGNIREAFAWSIMDNNRIKAGARLVTSLPLFWMARGHVREGRDWLAKLQLFGESTLPVPIQANLRLWLGRIDIALDHDSSAQAFLEQSMLQYQQLEDDRGVAETHLSLGRIERHRRNWREADRHLQHSLQLFKALMDKNGQANTLHQLGRLVAYQHDWQKAYMYHSEALDLYHQLNQGFDVANSLRALGLVAMGMGEIAQAHQKTKEALAFYHNVGHVRAIFICCEMLGELSRIARDYEAAAAHYRQSLTLAQEFGFSLAEHASLFFYIGITRLQIGEYVEANELFHQSLTLARQQNVQPVKALSIAGLAGVVIQRGYVERAASLLAAVTAWYEQAELRMEIADRMDFDRLVAKARTQLTDEAFATAWNEGSAMLLEQAEALALS